MAKQRKIELVRKDFLYRGKSLDEMKSLDVREAARFFTSRSRRTILRNFQIIENFIKTCERKIEKNKRIKTHLRDIVIVPKLVGLRIGIYNGHVFNEVDILPEMMGHRLGEFSPTCSKVNHGSAGIGATKGSKTLKK